MGFTKLDSGLLKSSILAESLETFKVWIILLAACDENGVAEVSPIYLESVCRIPLAKIKEALAILESPDENSRSENDDGRRIERVDGGFKILNYQKYRIKSYSKSKEAIRKREWREKKASECPKSSSGKRDITGHVPNVTDNSASASSSASRSSSGNKEKVPDPIDVKLVQLLIDLMLRNNPGSSIIKRLTPERQADWIRQCRLLREADGKSPEEIERVIAFSQTDSFWKSNILSMPKLREKWDQLWMKAQRGDPLAGIREWLAGKEKKHND